MKIKKFFENNEPQVGDYVACKFPESYSKYVDNNVVDFINNNIGKLIKIDNYNYIIKYNLPEEIEKGRRLDRQHKPISLGKEDIIYWSKNKEELEIILNTNKYNL